MRVKIFLPNLLIVLILGGGIYYYLNAGLAEQAARKLDTHMQVVSGLFDRSEALHGYELLNVLRRQAMSRAVTSVFVRPALTQNEGETQAAFDARIRDAWFRKAVSAVETYSDEWAGRGRKPAIVFMTDRNGVVLARNTTPNACPAGKRVDRAIPVVKHALNGDASYAIWALEKSPFDSEKIASGHLCSLINTGLLELAAAPIWGSDENVAGALVVGFEVSNGTAAEKSASLGVDLAVIAEGRVYSSSFSGETARLNLNKALFSGDGAARVRESIKTGKPSELFTIEVEGQTYRTRVSPLVNAEPEDGIALVYLGSVKNSRHYSDLLKNVLIAAGFAAFLTIVVGFLLAQHFIRPIVAIEEGLLKIINGEYEYRFDVESAEVGGLSYRINQLVNELTGKDESGDAE